MKTCSSFLNCVSSTPLDIALKVSSSEKKSSSVDGECPDFSLWLYLRTQGEFKIRPFRDSRKQFFLLSRKQNAFCKNKLHQRTYLPESYLWRKSPLVARYFLTVALKCFTKSFVIKSGISCLIERRPPIKTQLENYHTQKGTLTHTIKKRQ